MATVTGTDSGETINATDGVTNGADTIFGWGGNDSIFGLGGNDTIKGGGGADAINGGTGTDTANYFDSWEGVGVSLVSGAGFGGTAEGDTLTSIENLTGSSHADYLVGNDGNNVLTGLADNDLLEGRGGVDILYGDSGNDTLKGGGGADALVGGSGIDTAAYNESSVGVKVYLNLFSGSDGDAEGDELYGIENVTGSAYKDTLWGNDDANVLKGMNGNDSLAGFGGADSLWGGDGNDLLAGFEGADTLRGEDGSDVLNGGEDADTLIGGLGGDTYLVDNAGDAVTEAGGQGTDQVWVSVSWTLTAGADVEMLRTTDAAGVDAIDLTGNATGNVVRGNNGNNTINGGDGDDELTGFGGQDSFRFDTALNAAINVDVITDFSVTDDTIVLENTIFGAFSAGDLAEERFITGTTPLQANDNILYDITTGALYYDSDGNGAAAAVQFAAVTAGTALTHQDFIVS